MELNPAFSKTSTTGSQIMEPLTFHLGRGYGPNEDCGEYGLYAARLWKSLVWLLLLLLLLLLLSLAAPSAVPGSRKYFHLQHNLKGNEINRGNGKGNNFFSVFALFGVNVFFMVMVALEMTP